MGNFNVYYIEYWGPVSGLLFCYYQIVCYDLIFEGLNTTVSLPSLLFSWIISLSEDAGRDGVSTLLKEGYVNLRPEGASKEAETGVCTSVQGYPLVLVMDDHIIDQTKYLLDSTYKILNCQRKNCFIREPDIAFPRLNNNGL